MARLFPNRLPGRVYPGVARVFRRLKKLPHEFSVWYSLPSTTNQAPHFLVIRSEQYAFLIQVEDLSQEAAELVLQDNLFATGEALKPDDVGSESINVLSAFDQKFARENGNTTRKIVAFPNVEQQTLDAIRLRQTTSELHPETAAVEFLGMHQLSEAAFLSEFEKCDSKSLDHSQIIELRHRFTPEIAIPDSFSPLQIQDRNNTPTLFTGLLDLDQEWCTKNNLFLPEETHALVENLASANHHLITGVAGSGKSLVLLYRVMLCARLNPGARILILTHNKPIIFELQNRFSQLNPDYQPNVEWITFFSWAKQFLNPWPDRDIISPARTLEILESYATDRYSVEFLAEEIGYLKDHNIRTESDYLNMSRQGRNMALKPSQRKAIWAIFVSYQRQLEHEGKVDWHGVAMRFHKAVTGGSVPFPCYDCIFIDEAQFFAKVWFDTVRAALKPGGELFLAADPTQGFLKRRQSWLASGIDIRGRSHCLRQAYRNSRAILRFAADFCRQRNLKTLGETDLNVPDAGQIELIPVEGSPPHIIHCASEQDIQSRAVSEIAQLRDSGHPNGQVLVLHANSRVLALFKGVLERKLGQTGSVHDTKLGLQPSGAFCRVSTLNAATGLESPIVFLLGIDFLLEKEDNPRLTDDQVAELRETHTKQLYMAITRAGQKLVILTRYQKTEEILRSLIN